MKHTPLNSLHRRLGARLVEFGGWEMPLQYGAILDEVRAVRAAAGLFDLSHMGRIRVSGAGRHAFLDRVCTCFVARIPAGAIRYSLLCRHDGNPIDDLLVYQGEGEVFLVVNASNTAACLEWLHSQPRGADVVIEDQTEALALIAVQGQRSGEILAQLVRGCDLTALGYYKQACMDVCGLPGTRVSRTGYTGELGYELFVPAGQAERVWEQLSAAGASQGLQPVGLAARDTLRLEAGMPLYGHEIDAEHNPIEAGLAFGVSFAPEKGDWIGRAALERIARAPRRTLVGFTTPGPRVPRQGHLLRAEGRELGTVVSGALSPTLETMIGTAYVPVGAGAGGERAELDVKGRRQEALFRPLPFFSRTRQ